MAGGPGETVFIDAFAHPVSEFVHMGFDAGLDVEEIGERGREAVAVASSLRGGARCGGLEAIGFPEQSEGGREINNLGTHWGSVL